MNILFYCDEYPPYITGGIGSVTKILGEELVKRGHNVYVVGYYPYNTKLPVFSNINGVNIYRLNIGLRNGIFRNAIFKILERLRCSDVILKKELVHTEKFIASLIVDKHVNILEMTDYYYFNAAKGLLPFRKFNVPTVLRIHGSFSFFCAMKKLKNIFHDNDAAHFSRCDYLSAVSEFSYRFMSENFDFSPYKDSIVIKNPIEASFFKYNEPSNEKRILYVGKLVEPKGCFSVLKAFNSVVELYPDWKLILAGSGNVETASKYCSDKAKSNVIFRGFCSRDALKSEIDRCSFACLPSYYETLGMAALEIMARCRTVIFTNRSAGPEVIDNNENGLIVNPENIEELRDAMISLIKDESKRNRFSQNAYDKVKNDFAVSAICDQTIYFYNKIIQNEL